MGHFCTLNGIRHSLRTPYSPWNSSLIIVQNKNIVTHLRMCLQNTPKDLAYAYKSQPLSAVIVSPHEIVLEFPSLLIQTLIVIQQKLAYLKTVFNFLNTHIMTKLTLTHFSPKHFQNLSHIGFLPLKLQCYKVILQSMINKSKNQL